MTKTKEPAPRPKASAASGASPPAPPPPPAYTVVARRYRPQQFDDLIGQEHVAQALKNALTSGRIAHAYLFTGARGTGKTSTARILAKALNCEKGPTAAPCDRCDLCRSVATGDDVDVIEIDGASNNKVDEVRDLRSNVGFRPTRGRFKVYIIDEVHMLSTSAFNALLKTLEEPPPHVKFILATTEVQKIPITILSRCQRYDFATVGPAKILEALKNVAAQEGIDADEDALRIVARRANGSMRDSQTLLEQLLGATDGRLTAAKVHAVFGTLLEEEVIGLASAILEGDARRAVEMIGSVGERGRNLGELLDQLVDYWRGLMLAAVGGGDLDSLPGSPATREQMARDAAGRNLDAVLAGIDILTATKSKMRGSPHTQVLLEVAVVRLARLDELLGVAQLAQWVTGGGQPLQPSAGKGTPPTPPSVSTERVKKKVVPAPESKSNEAITSKMGHGEPGKEEPFEVVWDRVLEQVGPVLSAQLRQPPHSQAILGPNTLAIQYASAYNSTYDFVRGERNLDTLRRALKHVTGREWVVRVDLLTDPVANGSPSAVEPPTDAPPTPSPVRTRSQLLALPFFQAATEVLGAQLMRVDDGFDPTGEPAAPVTTDAEAAPDHPTDPDEV